MPEIARCNFSDLQIGPYRQIALGYSAEPDNQILMAHELEYIDNLTCAKLSNEIDPIKNIFTSFIRKIKPRA